MPSPDERALLLSLKPEFAEAILAGTKRVELRRIRPRALPGTLVVIYATAPTMAIVGGCRVAAVTTGTPDEVWDLHGALTALDRDRYNGYFAGAATAVAIQVEDPWRIRNPVPLSDLRAAWAGFHPPQSYQYVAAAELGEIVPSRRTRGRRATAS